MAVEPEVAAIARDAAQRLSELDPSLPATIEAEIARGEAGPPQKFDPATAIALASLVLAIVQFGYQIYRDTRADKRVAPETLKRQIRVELAERGYPDSAKREAVIEAAVAAIEAGRR
jgi:hypothetical protein